jgi:osomolarity two-component system sensor histidine kinase TcsA
MGFAITQTTVSELNNVGQGLPLISAFDTHVDSYAIRHYETYCCNMAQLTDRIFALSPNPTVILDPSLCVQQISDSFLNFTRTKSNVWIGSNFFEQIQNESIVTGFDGLRIQDAAEATVRLRQIQHAMVGTDHGEDLRVIPIVEDGVLLHVVLEWQLNTQWGRKAVADYAGLGTDEAFQLLVGAVKDYAIFLLDIEGNVRTWNIGAELIKGYKSNEIIGRNFSTFYVKTT